MKALRTILTGGAALAALTVAAPASAQYYPGYGYGNGGQDIISTVIGTVLGGGMGSPYGGGGYGSPYGYGGGYGSPYGGGYGSPYGGGYGSPYGNGGYGSPYGNMGQGNQYAVGQCMGAVQQRLNATYARYSGQQSARVLGVSDVQRRSNGGTLVSGVANSGRTNSAYGYNNAQSPVDLTFTCKTDSAGYVSSIEIGQAEYVNGQSAPAYTPYANDYSRYGYSRY